MNCASLSLRLSVVMGGLLVIIGAKLWLVGNFGNGVPFWDQWDAEGRLLFKPFLAGTLRLDQLFAYHNEHRTLFTRLVALALLTLSGQWNPLHEMIVNAVVHASALGILLVTLARGLTPMRQLALMLFIVAINVIPFGWENTLWGFQLQFYALLLFGVGAIALLFDAAAWSARWWIGMLLAIASCFTAASGALTLAAPVALRLAQMLLGQRRNTREFAGVVVQGVALLAVVHDIPSLAYHSSLVAHSLQEGLIAAVMAAGWPLVTGDWMVRFRPLAVLVVNGPLLLVAFSLLRDRPAPDDRRWYLVALGVWIALQIGTLAYARAAGVWASRYFDIFTVGIVVNAACVLTLVGRTPASRPAVAARVAAALWFVALLVGFAEKAERLPTVLAEKREASRLQAETVKAFLDRGDFAALGNAPASHLPHPSADVMRDVLSDPAVRKVVSPGVLGEESWKYLDRLRESGAAVAAIGLGLLLIGLGRGRARRREEEDQRECKSGDRFG